MQWESPSECRGLEILRWKQRADTPAQEYISKLQRFRALDRKEAPCIIDNGAQKSLSSEIAQNRYFKANCIIRGSRELRIWPKTLLLTIAFTPPSGQPPPVPVVPEGQPGRKLFKTL